MAFGIGINSGPVSSGQIYGKQTRIACDCWFTANGRTIPHTIKYKDIGGAIRTINDISVKYYEDKNYAGIPSTEYSCTIINEDRKMDVRLIFFTDEKRWVMVT